MLRKIFLAAFCLALASGTPLDPVDLPGYPLFTLQNKELDPFIVGGSVATAGQFPYQAALRTPAGLFFCGAVIISNVS